MSRSKSKASRSSNVPNYIELEHGINGRNGMKHKNGATSSKSAQPGQPKETGVLDSKDLLHVLTQVKNGNFSVRMPIDEVGISGKICDTLNEIIDMNEKMMRVITQGGNTIGKQGKL